MLRCETCAQPGLVHANFTRAPLDGAAESRKLSKVISQNQAPREAGMPMLPCPLIEVTTKGAADALRGIDSASIAAGRQAANSRAKRQRARSIHQ